MIADKLKKGDTVGIIAPSSGVAFFCPNRFNRGVNQLEKMGFNVKIGNNAKKKFKHMSATIDDRIQDIHNMFSDINIKAIICTIGGYSSHQLLEYLDYELIRNNPKIIMGYSDITALLNGIYSQTDLVTYIGPALLPQFAEYGGVLPYTLDYFKKILMNDNFIEISPSKQWTDEITLWDKEDNRKRNLMGNTGFKVIKHGVKKVIGNIIGGNIGTLLLLAGTKYFPSFENAILFIEEDESETPATIDRFFTQLRQIGVYQKIKGMCIGRFHTKVGFNKDNSLEDIVNIATTGYNFPIISELDFGHTDPMITIPIGGKCVLQTDPVKIIFSNF